MFRFIRASFLFVRIFWSYGWLWVFTRLLGRKRMANTIRRTHTKNAKRLYRGFIRLRGVFIKVGQVLSVLGSFLPTEFIIELQGLQDQVEAQKFSVIKKTFLREHGKPPGELFESFAETPIAAASLGQVHRAKLLTGEDVAVKVLYPNVEAIIRTDLRVLRWVMNVWGRIVPVNNLNSIFRQLADVLGRETDYTLEASNLKAIKANFVDQPEFVFPDVYSELSSKGILVMSYIDAIKITDVAELEARGISRRAVAKMLVNSYYKQLLLDGLYHADPHPGNFLVRPGPELVFLDFGAVEPVRDSLKRGMIMMLEGIIGQDDDKALVGIETMGFVAEDGNRKLLEKTVRHYFTKLVTLKVEDYGNMKVDQIVSKEEIRSVRGQMRELMRSVRYPDGYFYIERSLVLLFGLCAVLDPKVNALELGFPYAMQFILQEKQAQMAAEAASQQPAA